MPTVQENRATFDVTYPWSSHGDEWSAAYGGPAMQWHGMLLPRITSFVPAGTIVEIACGYGRWTHYLKDLCEKLIVIDLSEKCINHCKKRFENCSHISYITTDGTSLDMIADNSVDFIFSFDSLVHVDHSVMNSYLMHSSRILAQEGVAFLHHSNLGEYRYFLNIQKIPKLWGILTILGVVEKSLHWRDFTVTAALVEQLAGGCGLQCISQEIIPWGTKRAFIDCMSTIVKKTSKYSRSNRKLRNTLFPNEAQNLKALSWIYSFGRDESSPSLRT